MKITLEFEHSYELIQVLKLLGSNLKQDEPISEATALRILDEFKVHTATIEKD